MLWMRPIENAKHNKRFVVVLIANPKRGRKRELIERLIRDKPLNHFPEDNAYIPLNVVVLSLLSLWVLPAYAQVIQLSQTVFC